MRKKVDPRIRTLVENGVKTRQRSLFVIVGDKGREQVVNLHYMLSKAVVKTRPSVLWCYKKELLLSSHRKKRMRQLKKMMQRGLLDPEKEDPFALFMASTAIRYCYYSETHKILGNTFGMCVLQDFEALTPNLLARTIETVEGGGLVILLISSLTSLTRLYTMAMDVHSRFRTESHGDVVGRFNERFILSLASCPVCCVADDELNILPLSSHIRAVVPAQARADAEEELSEAERELRDLKDALRDTRPVGPLVAQCRTLDQARAVVTFLDAISEKTLRSTVALTAARGRGKSAALGVAIAGAVGLGYANIFVTAPSPENLKTLFEFVFKGFDAMDYKEHMDYEIIESTNPSFNRAIVRVNVFRSHRQTIQFVLPQHAERVQQAELLVIDEAAAIPLPMVRALLGPYLVFMCSTVNGYEGTGRSLSLKLIQQLREQSQGSARTSVGGEGAGPTTAGAGRVLREVELKEPIRYAAGDPVEAWLNSVLCLDAAKFTPRLRGRMPHPGECELYYVNRDTLFSYHSASEAFLQRMMALYVASHYKNTPNDLQLMSDAPAHHLFVLLGPVDKNSATTLPDVLCVLQVCLEGQISRQSALRGLAQGAQPTGDLLPWTLSQQFQDSEFPSLSGARVVRIAVHPDLQRAGYGSRALDLLVRYYQGELTSLHEEEGQEDDDDEDGGGRGSAKKGKRDGHSLANGSHQNTDHPADSAAQVKVPSLLEESLEPRADLPPLLLRAVERAPERLHYVGSSFGLSQSLFSFWRKQKFVPLYIRQTPSDVTGEHTCIVLRALATDDVTMSSSSASTSASWLKPFQADFELRFITLLGSAFREMSPAMALSILDPTIEFSEPEAANFSTDGILQGACPLLTPYDMKRLESYANNLVDYHLILDLVPPLARLFFLRRLPVTLSYAQAAILASLGLQQLDISSLEGPLKLSVTQLLALFNKAMRKLHALLYSAAAKAVEGALPRAKDVAFKPHHRTVDEDLAEGALEAKKKMKAQLQGGGTEAKGLPSVLQGLKPEQLQQYMVTGQEENFEAALGGGGALGTGIVSVKASSTSAVKAVDERGKPPKQRGGSKGAKRARP